MQKFYTDLIDALHRYGKVAVATVIHAQGSVPRMTGTKILVFPDRTFRYSIGGGIFESKVVEDALAVLADGRPVTKKYSFNEQGQFAIGAVCGGMAEVMIEMVQAAPKLMVIGGGHVGKCVVRMALWLGYDVTLIDDREEFATWPDPKDAVRCIHTPADYSAMPEPDASTFVCLVSKGYVSDEAALRRLIRKPARYIGMIGSQKKIKKIYDNMKQDGFDEKLFERVHAPIGIDIHADSPEEIAVSVMAEIIRIKNTGE